MGKPKDYALILNSVMWFQVILASLVVALRVYTRRCIIQNLGLDDLVMVANLVSIHRVLSPRPLARFLRQFLTTLGHLHRIHCYYVGWRHVWPWEEN
jgi:hypothetical protein